MLRSIFRLAERSVPNPRGGSAEDCAFRDRSSLDCAFEATGLMPANQGTYIGRDCCSSRRGLADYRRKGSCISCPAWRVIVEQPACAPSSVARSTAFRVSSGPPRGSSQTTTRSRLHSFWQGQPVRSSESSCLSKCIFPGRIASGNYNLKARLKCFFLRNGRDWFLLRLLVAFRRSLYCANSLENCCWLGSSCMALS